MPRVETRQVVGRVIGDTAAAVRRALQRQIVMNHDNTVAGELNVEFEAVCAERETVIERFKRVFGT